jgi:glycosyltransferase involved in cell wall biosynthesis
MNTVFVFDMKYIKCNDLYYTIGGLTYDKLSEYIACFGKIKMFTRSINIDKVDLNKVKIASGNNIEFSTINTKGILKLFTKQVYKRLYSDILNAEIVIIRLPSFLGIIAYRIVKKLNKPYIVELVGCPLDSLWNYGNLKGKIIAPIMYCLTKNIIKKSEYVHYVSEKFLQDRYPTNGKMLECSDVIINNIDEHNLESKLSRIKSKNDNKYIFGIVGSLDVNYKGHEVSIKALSLLKDIDFELHLLGSGKKEKWIRLAKKYKIEDRVFFDGTLPSGKPVFEWLDNLDIHLIMSKTEGLPRILVEAMSRGSISIGSDVGGIPELISKDCIVDKNDYRKLADKIEYVLSDKNFQITTAQINFNKSKEFEKDKLDKKRQEFYINFINNVNIQNKERR